MGPVASLGCVPGPSPVCPQPPADMNLAKVGNKRMSLASLELGPGRWRCWRLGGLRSRGNLVCVPGY